MKNALKIKWLGKTHGWGYRLKDKLQTIIDKHSLLSDQLADPKIFNDQKKLTTTAKEHSALEDVVNVGKEYLAVLQNIEDDKSILDGDDAELKEIAQEELIELESRKDKLESDLKILLLPRDPNDDKNLILEIRAGTGGDEAALFAADLFRVYTRYAERKRWKYKNLTSRWFLTIFFMFYITFKILDIKFST